MPIPAPQSAFRRFLRSDAPWDVATAVSGLGSGAAGAYRFFSTDPSIDPHAPTWGWLLLAGVVVSLALQIGKAVRRFYKEKAEAPLHDLAGCLHTLVAILGAGQDRKSLGLRATVWVPSSAPGTLVQALDYVGDQRKKRTQGRTSSTNVGAIGRAFREKKTVCAARSSENYDEFIRFMVKDYGYSEDEARLLDPATMAWLAVPLIAADGEVDGVLYLDCKVPTWFEEGALALVALAVDGIAYFVGLRYTSK